MTSNATATTTTGATAPASPEAILRAMREIDLLPKNKDWLLMDPAGNYWKTDDIAMLMAILARHHPLLRHPMTFANPFDASSASHKEGA